MALVPNTQPDLGPLSDRSNARSPSPDFSIVQASGQTTIRKSPSSLHLTCSEISLADGVDSVLQPADQDASAEIDELEVSQHQDPSTSTAETEHDHDIGRLAPETSPARVTSAQFKNRPYGRPLSTILERSSYATLRSKLSHSSSKRRFTPVHIDPDSKYLHTEFIPIEEAERVKAFSFDEGTLSIYQPKLSDGSSEQLSSNPTLRPSFEDAITPSLPPFEPPRRIATPEGLPRWPNDVQSRPTYRHLRRRSNPFLAISGLIRRASASNERLRQGLWRPPPGSGTPGFDELENHPFSTGNRTAEPSESPACRSLSLALDTGSPNQPPKPRKISPVIPGQSPTIFHATASLPRSLEIRNDRRAAASEQTFADNPQETELLTTLSPAPPSPSGQSTSGENTGAAHSLTPSSPVLLPQQSPPIDRVSKSPLELDDTCQANPKADSPFADHEPTVPRSPVPNHPRLQTWSEESPSFLSNATRGDTQQRYARSGVPIYCADAASDRTIPPGHVEPDEVGDEDNAHLHVGTPERKSRNLDDVPVSPEQEDTVVSTPRDAAAASLSSRHLFTSPAISNTRRTEQPSARTPILPACDGYAGEAQAQGGVVAEIEDVCPHHSRAGFSHRNMRENRKNPKGPALSTASRWSRRVPD
ncbi:MAG: hypothetical protein M1821_006144 [Bathelium mastoideum]|nr:MAG: hypothetical protein M1821_006144 [Bathelium mastoideum]